MDAFLFSYPAAWARFVGASSVVGRRWVAAKARTEMQAMATEREGLMTGWAGWLDGRRWWLGRVAWAAFHAGQGPSRRRARPGGIVSFSGSGRGKRRRRGLCETWTCVTRIARPIRGRGDGHALGMHIVCYASGGG